MGWSTGTGLGTDGEGRVDPMYVSRRGCAHDDSRTDDRHCSETAIFAQGVGLGASKGKEIGKYADGYSGYVSAARDSVRSYIPTSLDVHVTLNILTLDF